VTGDDVGGEEQEREDDGEETRAAGDTPESAEQALARAAQHARAAAAELVAALRALVDAASLAASGQPGGSGRLAPLALVLDEVQTLVSPEPGGGALAAAIAEALDAEIARWEERGRDDPDARAVLRAFLGLRELLWEMGVRPAANADAAGTRSRGRRRRGRLERVPVEG
jgi:hypothetical protein